MQTWRGSSGRCTYWWWRQITWQFSFSIKRGGYDYAYFPYEAVQWAFRLLKYFKLKRLRQAHACEKHCLDIVKIGISSSRRMLFSRFLLRRDSGSAAWFFIQARWMMTNVNSGSLNRQSDILPVALVIPGSTVTLSDLSGSWSWFFLGRGERALQSIQLPETCCALKPTFVICCLLSYISSQ